MQLASSPRSVHRSPCPHRSSSTHAPVPASLACCRRWAVRARKWQTKRPLGYPGRAMKVGCAVFFFSASCGPASADQASSGLSRPGDEGGLCCFVRGLLAFLDHSLCLAAVETV
eukprot:1137494-Pelagomonas_calceolata.AAC.10